nr:TlpA disulfide reductase family protein [uncultured Flavobacterium sp.]
MFKKNKYIILIALFSAFSVFAQQKKAEGYVVKVKLKNSGNYKIGLTYYDDDKIVVDSAATVENGVIILRGKVKEPTVAYLGWKNNPALSIKMEDGYIPGPVLKFFLSNEVINIEGEADKIYAATVKGGVANTDWSKIRDKESALTGEQWNATREIYPSKTQDSTAVMKYYALSTKIYEASNKLQDQFTKDYPNSHLSMYFLTSKINNVNIDVLKAEYDRLGNEYKSGYYGRMVAEKIKSVEATNVGKTAIPFSKNDINGNIVSLETLKGKYVLLDFWGSWCGPCRASHPHLKDLYSKYKDKGFEILGIAYEQGKTLEANKEKWKSAVAADGITWLQVLNNEDVEKMDVVKAYGVSAFPTKVLLDRDGKVLARYVGESKELDAVLEKIFAN